MALISLAVGLTLLRVGIALWRANPSEVIELQNKLKRGYKPGDQDVVPCMYTDKDGKLVVGSKLSDSAIDRVFRR